MFAYLKALREDLKVNSAHIAEIVDKALDKQAVLLRRYEYTAWQFMNITVSEAFDADYRLQNMDLFLAYHEEDAGDEPLYKFAFADQEFHEEYDAAFFAMSEDELGAYAVTLYIALSYFERDPVLRECYNTRCITHPEYTALNHRIHLASPMLYRTVDLRETLEQKVAGVDAERKRMLAAKVRNKFIAKIYAPDSSLFKAARDRFNKLA